MEKIKRVFQNRKPEIIGSYRKSAVMILLYEENDETYIVFEVRSSSLKHQPGDICLPGGRLEEEESSRDAAVRETLEELNVESQDIEYVGEMDYFISPYKSIIYPHVAYLKKSELQPNVQEVDHVFKVPVSFFVENEPVLHTLDIVPCIEEDFPYHLIKNGRDYKFSTGKLEEYFYQYGEYVIWGFTALIIKAFIDILKKENCS